MITIDILEQNGYKKYYDHLYASAFWQKRVWDHGERKTLYFINLYQYDRHNDSYYFEMKLAFDSNLKFTKYCWLTYYISSSATLEDVEIGAGDAWRMHQGIAYDEVK